MAVFLLSAGRGTAGQPGLGAPEAAGGPGHAASLSSDAASVPVGSARGPDFNGDGVGDLAVGVPLENIGSTADAGAVDVLFGSPNGVVADGDQFWSQNAGDIGGSSDQADQFGTALAAGDFNGDGFADLAVGAPFETFESVRFSGAVNVLYGSAVGPTDQGNQVWTQDTEGILDQVEANDLFGSSLTAGDFDGDGFDDLVVGSPGEKVGTTRDAGAVNVVYGSAAGLASEGNQLWTQDSEGIGDSVEADDQFGAALAAGDVNGDGRADLFIGVPLEDFAGAADAGLMHGIRGSVEGLTSDRSQVWTQDLSGILDQVEAGDLFGSSIAIHDFDGDGFGDVAAGVQSEGVGSASDAGAVNVLYGTATGLSSDGNQFFNQSTAGIAGTAEAQDFFGEAVAAGDFDGDGFGDLAIGVYREDIGSDTDTGAVHVLPGSAAGLTATGSQLWEQDSPNVKDSEEPYDLFGWAIGVADYGKGPEADLAIGVVLEGVGGDASAGAVNLLYGSATGVTATGNQFWHQDVSGVEGSAERGDEFGHAIASGTT